MYLRESSRRNRDGSVVRYFQIAKNEWDPLRGRARPRILCNLGRADAANRDRLKRLAQSILRHCDPSQTAAEHTGIQIKKSWAHGDFHVVSVLWERLGLRKILEDILRKADRKAPLERALFAMVANRCIRPTSKLDCWERWMREEVYFPEARNVELQHLYRAMDVLEWNKEIIEREVYFGVADLLSLDVDLIFYDTTSLHFEIEEEDSEEREFRGRIQPPLRKRGYPKNGRWDVPQIVVGMAVTRDGIPVRSWVFPGNMNDRSTIERVKADLTDWRLTRCIFVSDAGTVSGDNLKTLSAGGGKYIVCVPARLGDEVTKQVIGHPGRFKAIAENLAIKEVSIPTSGEGRRRYVVCYNEKEALRTKHKREDILLELEGELKALDARDEDHPVRACDLVASPQYRRYLKKLKSGRLTIDQAKVRSEERFDGKWVIRSNDDSLSAEDLARGYKQLMVVENGWRDLKSMLRLRPVNHRSPHRIKAHVSICVLALMLQRVIERACSDTWRNVRHHLQRIQVSQLITPHGEVVQRNLLDPEACKCLQTLEIDPPPEILAAC